MPVLAALLNAWSTERANEQAAINQANQNKWNEKMWNLNNAYNDPINQKHRLENAGINPYSVLAGDGADTGNSSSPAEGVSPAPVYRTDFSNSVGLDLLAALKSSKEIEGQSIANEQAKTNLAFLETEKFMQIAQTRAQIKKLLSSSDFDEAYKDYLRTQDSVLEGQAEYIIRQSRASANQAETISQNLQREYDDRHYESLAKRAISKAQIRVSDASIKEIGQRMRESVERIKNLREERNLTAKQVKTEIAKEADTIISTYLKMRGDKRDTNKVKADIMRDMWDTLMESSEIKLPFGSVRPPHPAVGFYSIDTAKGLYDDLDSDW